MPSVSESVHVHASLAETWDLYFDAETWPAWVDGFARVEAAAGYPDRDGTLRWRSTPAGRGEVTERVVAHEPRTRHRVAFSDPESEGELETTFAIEASPDGEQGVTVRQELTYRLREAGPLTRLTDVFFIRPQVTRSVRRSLERLRTEVEELAASSSPGARPGGGPPSVL
jgi:Polyketide cyclase / dehydrase and lipid transport